MQTIKEALGFVVGELSDENYAKTLAFYRFWFETRADQIFDAIWDHRGGAASCIDHKHGKIFHAFAPLIVRFASDAESDHVLAPHSSGLQDRLCAKSLQEFFSNNLTIARYDGDTAKFYADVNLIAHWANLGYVEEAVIRSHILQSLISQRKPYIYQAFALIILFKLAGATFGAYVDPSVVDLCFEHLKTLSAEYSPKYDKYRGYGERRKAIQVCVAYVSSGGNRTKAGVRGLFKRLLRYGSAVGKVSLPHLYSRTGSPNQAVQTRKTPPRLQSPHPSDFLTGTSNLKFLHPLR